MPETVEAALALEFPLVWNAVKNTTYHQLDRIIALLRRLQERKEWEPRG